MVVSALAITPLSVVLGIIIPLGLVYVLVQCVCGKKKDNADDNVELQDVTSKHNSTVLSDSLIQTNVTDNAGIHLEVDTAVTPLNTSIHSQNGTLHSRGNSVDLNKTDRQSGASAGSSPRPNTISRELPDIPVSKTQTHSHSQLPELPSNGRVGAATLDSHYRGHGQLPEIPPNARASTLSTLDTSRGGHSHLPELLNNHPSSLDSSKGSNHSSSITSNNGARPKVVSPGTSVSPNKSPTDSMDDYDHINETKRKNRPRSDYDHVVIEGDTKRIIPAKQRPSDDNDYAEVKNENIYEGVPEDITVISVSKPNVTSIKVGRSSPRKTVPTTKLHKVDSIDDPYNRIKGDDPPYNKIIDDPYNKIKVDDPYNTVKDDDPYNNVKDTGIDDLDPYDDPDLTESKVGPKRPEHVLKVVDDPYAFVIDEERNVSNQTDPYARVGDTESELEDPYNKVNDDNDSSVITSNIPEDLEDDYSTVNKDIDVEYAKVNKNLTRESAKDSNQRNASDFKIIPSTSGEIRGHDEYATVQKVRKFSEEDKVSQNLQSASNTDHLTNCIVEENQSRVVTEPQTPPEPPRGYAQDPVPDIDHYNTLSVGANSRIDQTDTQENVSQQTVKKREPPYNKLSVRESLASMNARIASNPYEYVSEVDNLYATVDGSSGDGVVKRKSVKTEQRESTASEYYTEIEGAASAPAPPSLDSLHETAKHHLEERRKGDLRPGDVDYYKYEEDFQGQGVQGHARTPSGQRTPSGHENFIQGHQRTPSGQGHIRTPSGDAIMTSSYEGMTSSYEGPVTMVTQNSANLRCDYQDIADEKISDTNSEFDPNYETVEEAKSKVKYEEIKGSQDENSPIRNHIYEEADSKRKYEVVNGTKSNSNTKIRAHVYEEVTVTNEARRVKQRVLSQHTYEEVTDVKGHHQSGNAKQENKGNVNDVQRRKKGHERTSSGDQSWFGKRKSGEMKDKQKDSKKRSEVKDKDHRKSGEKSS